MLPESAQEVGFERFNPFGGVWRTKKKTGEEQDGFKLKGGTCSDEGEYETPECVPNMVPTYEMCSRVTGKCKPM